MEDNENYYWLIDVTFILFLVLIPRTLWVLLRIIRDIWMGVLTIVESTTVTHSHCYNSESHIITLGKQC